MIKQERLVFFFFLFLFASARNSIFKVSRFLLCVTFFVVNLHLLSFLNSLFFGIVLHLYLIVRMV